MATITLQSLLIIVVVCAAQARLYGGYNTLQSLASRFDPNSDEDLSDYQHLFAEEEPTIAVLYDNAVNYEDYLTSSEESDESLENYNDRFSSEELGYSPDRDMRPVASPPYKDIIIPTANYVRPFNRIPPSGLEKIPASFAGGSSYKGSFKVPSPDKESTRYSRQMPGSAGDYTRPAVRPWDY